MQNEKLFAYYFLQDFPVASFGTPFVLTFAHALKKWSQQSMFGNAFLHVRVRSCDSAAAFSNICSLNEEDRRLR